MNQEELRNYIRNMQEQGVDDQTIKNNLIGAGWTEEMLEGSFSSQIPIPKFERQEQFSDQPLRQLDEKAVYLFMANHLKRLTVFILVIYVFFGSYIVGSNGLLELQVVLLIPAFLIFLIIAFVIAKLDYHFYRYALKEQGLYKEYGIIAKRYATIPYEKIQNIDIHQNIVARLLDMYSIKIQTAGMSGQVGAEGILPGLKKNDAEYLKNELLRRSRIIGKGNY